MLESGRYDASAVLNNLKRAVYQRKFSEFIKAAWPSIETAKYSHGWHVDLISEHLEAIYSGELGDTIFNIPPRCSKSTLISVMFPAWVWANDPRVSFLTASATQDLAKRDTQKCRQLMMSDWYQRYFQSSAIFAPDQNEKLYYKNIHGGARKVVSAGGSTTGHSGDFVIVDDAMDAKKVCSKVYRDNINDWYDMAMWSRVNHFKDSRRIVIMQRLHTEDLTGHLLEKGGWNLVQLPLEYEPQRKYVSSIYSDPREIEGEILCDRFDKDDVDDFVKSFGPLVAQGQLQQRPTLAEGALIKSEWIKYYTEPKIPKFKFWSWDTAIKTGQMNDYTVGTYWYECEDGYYLIDMLREKLEYPELRNKIQTLLSKYPANEVLIEDKASGQQIVQDFQRFTSVPIIPMTPGRDMGRDKESRVNLVAPLFESGKVFLPKTKGFVNDIIDELTAFPNGKHDDIVDSITQGLTRRLNALGKEPQIFWIG